MVSMEKDFGGIQTVLYLKKVLEPSKMKCTLHEFAKLNMTDKS